MKRIITLAILLISKNVFAQPCVPNTNSLSFNTTTVNTSNYVSINSQNNLNITDSITIEAWVYATNFGLTSANGSIFCKHGWSGGESGYVLRAGEASGILSFNIAGDSLGTNVSWRHVESPSGTLTLNTWYHVAATYDGDTLRLFVNGIPKGKLGFHGKIISSTYNPKISSLSDPMYGPDRYWSGKIDEVRIFHRALSKTEIADSMSAHIVPSAQRALVGYWRMNDGSGGTATDLSTSGNSGALSGATWSTSVPFNDAPVVPSLAFISGPLAVTNSCPNYQWYLGGVLIPGATHQTYMPTQNGIYTVVDTSVSCRITSAPYNLTALSVNENISNQSITLVPNPAHDYITVYLGKAGTLNHLTITDITGRIIYQHSDIGSADFKIAVNDFAKGIYFARFYKANVVLTKKFVVE